MGDLLAPFEVIGLPAPQGSKRHVGNGIMRESSKNLAPWRDAVAHAARDIAGDSLPLAGPLRLVVHFRFPMPKSRRAAVRAAGWAPKTSAPDLDKLVRSTGDALKAGGLIGDDALFAEITATKSEVIGWTGAEITVTDVLEFGGW